MPLREAMLSAFTAIIATARGTVRHVALEPEEALHDFRKSVRRARALVSLLRPALGRTAAAGLSGELRAAFQSTGALRDADILIATLRSVASDDPSRPIVERALAQEQARDGARAAEALAAGNRVLRPLPEVLRVTLPRAFSMDDLARGLARSCRRVRATLAQAVEAGTSAAFHEWRKRVKELRYQIELLASTGSAALKRREKALAALAEELGKGHGPHRPADGARRAAIFGPGPAGPGARRGDPLDDRRARAGAHAARRRISSPRRPPTSRARCWRNAVDPQSRLTEGPAPRPETPVTRAPRPAAASSRACPGDRRR